MAFIPPRPLGPSDTYRVASFHDVRRPGVWSISVEQSVFGYPVIWVEGPLSGNCHQSVLPAQVYLQPWLSVPWGRGPATAACGHENERFDQICQESNNWKYNLTELTLNLTGMITQYVMYCYYLSNCVWNTCIIAGKHSILPASC